MNFTRRILIGAMTVAVSVGLAAAPIQAEGLTKITFVQEWPVPDGFWIPWILGDDKGFYADEGIELQIVTPPTVADTMKYLGTGRADVAFTTIMDVVFAKQEEAPVTAIARYGRSNNWGILTAEGNPITVADLAGKTVGIYNDAWTKAQLTMMLADVGLTLDDINTVAASDDTTPLLLQGRVDAITGVTNAEGTGMFTSGGQTPEFLPAIEHGVPNAPVWMLAGNLDWLAANPDLAKAFLRATRKSIDYAIAHQDEAVAAFIARYANAYDSAFITQQWKDTSAIFGEPGPDMLFNVEGDWVALLDALKKFDVVANPLPATDYFTNAYLED